MGYFSTWTERAEAGVRLVAPFSLMAVLFIFSAISFTFPVTGSVKAPLLLMAIYYWAIYRPTLLPVWLIFLAGLLMDLISNLPLGLTALVFVLAQWIVIDQRRYLMGQSFLMIWIGFAIVSAAVALIQWGLFGLLSGSRWPSPRPLGFSFLFGVALFPLISLLLHMTHKILPEARASLILKTKRR